jgi:hypothetical protein
MKGMEKGITDDLLRIQKKGKDLSDIPRKEWYSPMIYILISVI